jgi:outer membrane protein insertion porin family
MGFGARIFLSVVGMLGIDWAYGFDVAPGTKKKGGSQFHFTVGQTF